jgi:hypothetical protein
MVEVNSPLPLPTATVTNDARPVPSEAPSLPNSPAFHAHQRIP